VKEGVRLFESAERFCIPALIDFCTEYFFQHLEVDVCCELLNVAKWFNAASLHEACIKFVEDHFPLVAKSEGFLRLDANLLIEILRSDNLLVTKEEQVYKAVMSWAQADPSSRLECLTNLLVYVRYPLMDRKFIESRVLGEDAKLFESYSSLVLKNTIAQALETAGSKEIQPLQQQQSQQQHVALLPQHNHELEQQPQQQQQDAIRKSSSADRMEVEKQPQLAVAQDDSTNDYGIRPRKGHNYTELLYSIAGDQNGVFNWIATKGKTQRWVNPHKCGLVKAWCSSPSSRYTKPEALVGNTFLTTSYTLGKPPYWAVDLGAVHSLICNHYCLHTDGGDAYVRNWSLQGSNDSKLWTDLRVHTSDDTLSVQGQFAAWPVHTKSASSSFRYFRVLMTGKNSLGAENMLSLCGLELYGYLLVVTPKKDT